MWAFNDSNCATNSYAATNEFYTQEDYAISAQWELNNGCTNYSDSEIDLATVLMNLKEDYPAHDCGAEPYSYQTTASGGEPPQQQQPHLHHSQHQQHHSQHQQHHSQHQQHHSQHQQHYSQPQHHSQHPQSWHTPTSDEHAQPQSRVLPVYDSLDSSCDYVHSTASDQNYLLPAILDVDESYSKTNSPIEKKRAGRPRGTKVKRSKAEPKLSRIWEFIRDLLLDAQYCPTYICWENYEEGRFRFVQSDKVAKLWGKFKRNERMNYEKFSRAMRYYYKTGVLLPVQGKRLVYKFGPKATGWHTDNPNFEYTY